MEKRMDAKINKYGFIHLGKKIRRQLELPTDADVALELTVDDKRRRLVFVVADDIEHVVPVVEAAAESDARAVTVS